MKTLLLLATALVASQAQVLYQDLAHDVSVKGTGISKWEGDSNGNGEFSFHATGDPIVVESAERGLTMTGPTIDGVFGRLPARSFVKELHVAGGAVVSFDGAAAYAGQVAQAKRLGKPAPPEPKETSTGDIKTERFDYAGDGTTGTFTVPSPFQLTSVTKGVVEAKKPTDPVKHFEQRMTVSGVSGTFDLDPSSSGDKKNFLRKGSIAGPIVFHVDRDEAVAGGASANVGKLDGSADKMEFDLTESRTITLSGHVKLNGETGAFLGSSAGDQAVITLSESNEVVHIRITGKPAKSTLREKTGGGR